MRGLTKGPSAEHVRQAMPLVTLAALVVVVGIVTPEFLRPLRQPFLDRVRHPS